MIVLDTNTLIYFFKGMGRVAEHLIARPPKEIGLPAIVVYELETGIAKSDNAGRRRRQLDEFRATARFLPFGAEEAARSAILRAELERQGTPIGPLDTLIAGTALARGAVLITHNTKEFSRVPGLQVGDWY